MVWMVIFSGIAAMCVCDSIPWWHISTPFILPVCAKTCTLCGFYDWFSALYSPGLFSPWCFYLRLASYWSLGLVFCFNGYGFSRFASWIPSSQLVLCSFVCNNRASGCNTDSYCLCWTMSCTHALISGSQCFGKPISRPSSSEVFFLAFFVWLMSGLPTGSVSCLALLVECVSHIPRCIIKPYH